jgi:hypothetical protein
MNSKQQTTRRCKETTGEGRKCYSQAESAVPQLTSPLSGTLSVSANTAPCTGLEWLCCLTVSVVHTQWVHQLSLGDTS